MRYLAIDANGRFTNHDTLAPGGHRGQLGQRGETGEQSENDQLAHRVLLSSEAVGGAGVSFGAALSRCLAGAFLQGELAASPLR